MTAESMLSITFIRHGESTDNLRPVWAGWADAPLSNHGINQARALGTSLSSTRFATIHASDLKRAASTAAAVHEAQPSPPPPLLHSSLLREQHFGIAEGKPWSVDRPRIGETREELWARGVFPVLPDRHSRFPEGESLDNLRGRADEAVERLLMPHLRAAAREGKRGVHIAVVSHGLCISELVPALLTRGEGQKGARERYSGLQNTAWTRVTVDVRGAKEGGTFEFPDNDPPPFIMRVTDVNRHEHLGGVGQLKVGSAAHDTNQKQLREFFGGGGAPGTDGVGALDHAKSNVEDHPVAECD